MGANVVCDARTHVYVMYSKLMITVRFGEI